ncbi:hypothetical protein GGX14DRAFT_403688 [Mycena pura]|uniref:Uncharacterized protein n=1 Tax=Mycena pura TaxID=153505 RepID=A0AAD6UVY8_9AGAR|nr:hypothetical protein GGX14DRAFT_403688 [Mycena pura]
MEHTKGYERTKAYQEPKKSDPNLNQTWLQSPSPRDPGQSPSPQGPKIAKERWGAVNELDSHTVRLRCIQYSMRQYMVGPEFLTQATPERLGERIEQAAIETFPVDQGEEQVEPVRHQGTKTAATRRKDIEQGLRGNKGSRRIGCIGKSKAVEGKERKADLSQAAITQRKGAGPITCQKYKAGWRRAGGLGVNHELRSAAYSDIQADNFITAGKSDILFTIEDVGNETFVIGLDPEQLGEGEDKYFWTQYSFCETEVHLDPAFDGEEQLLQQWEFTPWAQ